MASSSNNNPMPCSVQFAFNDDLYEPPYVIAVAMTSEGFSVTDRGDIVVSDSWMEGKHWAIPLCLKIIWGKNFIVTDNFTYYRVNKFFFDFHGVEDIRIRIVPLPNSHVKCPGCNREDCHRWLAHRLWFIEKDNSFQATGMRSQTIRI